MYVPVGSTNCRADAELIGLLRSLARGEEFDEQPMPGLDSEALDFRAASESSAPFRRVGRRDLETLRLVAELRGGKVPTIGGMFLFGTDRERHFSGARIQAGRFAGTDRAHILNHVETRSLRAVVRRDDGQPDTPIRHSVVDSCVTINTARLAGRELVREIGTGPQDPQRRYFRAGRGSA